MGLGKTVQLPDKSVICEYGKTSYAGKKYLDTHVRFKHPSEYSFKNLEESNNCQSDQQFDEKMQETCDLTELDSGADSSNNKTSNRREANQKKSYTMDFKVKTLDLLDEMNERKTKKLWEKVAERRGICKSLVVKWNKDRLKILGQLALNKKEQSAPRPTRQRQQLVSGKVKGEKFPLAAERVVVEFKLRTAKGCKISKLWLKKKMKEKITVCYGKEQAEKFRMSNNWFQRFKKRYGIGLRKKLNKKKCSASDGRETIQHFHRHLRKALKTRRGRNNAALDSKYGHWLPHNRYNVDQVPPLFFINKTYEVKGSEQVWVS